MRANFIQYPMIWLAKDKIIDFHTEKQKSPKNIGVSMLWIGRLLILWKSYWSWPQSQSRLLSQPYKWWLFSSNHKVLFTLNPGCTCIIFEFIWATVCIIPIQMKFSKVNYNHQVCWSCDLICVFMFVVIVIGIVDGGESLEQYRNIVTALWT